MNGLIWFWLGIWAYYILAVVMVGGGAYLAVLFDLSKLNPLYWLLTPLRWLGIGLVGAGFLLGGVTYGKQIGAEAVTAEWKAKNYEAQIARLKQEANAKQIAADSAAQQAQQLASQNDDLQKQVADYQEAASKLPVCRRATDDDDRRMRDIIGHPPSRGSNPR